MKLSPQHFKEVCGVWVNAETRNSRSEALWAAFLLSPLDKGDGAPFAQGVSSRLPSSTLLKRDKERIHELCDLTDFISTNGESDGRG
jgi:hypothetical protein